MVHARDEGEYAGIRYFRSGSDPEVFLFVPRQPGPEKDPAGRPTLLLANHGAGSSLQLGTRWEAEAAAVERLRSYLAETYQVNAALITLRPASLQISSVALVVGDGNGADRELKRNPSSGYAPLTAIFQASLDAEQSNAAIAALNGRRGFLTLVWRGTLALPGGSQEPVEATADVADWFQDGSGLHHMMMVAGAAAATSVPRARSVEVACGFEAAGAPVALVELESAGAAARLVGPQLAATHIDADPSAGLRLRTTYTTGGDPYLDETGPISGVQCLLAPAHLGLALITLDATGRRRAGASSLHVRITYTPTGQGTADERVFRFRYGEWLATWFVISRFPGLGGYLEYSTTSGAESRQAGDGSPVRTDNVQITL